MVKILIFGTFDKLHKGHIYFMEKAAEIVKDAELFIVIARDKNVEKIKNKIPIHNEMTRLMNVYVLGIAKKVILGDDEDFFKAIKEYKPTIICLGYDQNDQGIRKYIKENNLKIEIKTIDSFEPETYKSSKL
ncbi:adenylyltransferase/cytidyltransferase family protein [Candidatus Woesearchaeota archaeon]|jgi:FAD synthetase|nr:adenylyltransferase/cytidyltransferase family protein [Candidatus Woesearchaeota archaeon]MBT5272221.1 adenylyltransferase/cytidyltransferase family protein [Candidatus Woesearchaeota archaeon]MBT6040517.1 adenylyltransferase/cytidyltransferase family protein [Candidatus Woesearchaeota archaeon]MBT6336493.1 adenylyltransferase/cytidyltransferase family protein [Candidatus Woesearchaeota archaeon]MBT7927383.1 adenylyltransferase/cytidyltransferase family protein [Candidatus Woesearchaeota arc